MLCVLEKKNVQAEQDVQARACVVALLCLSKNFVHDEAFARKVMNLLQDFENHRPNAFERDFEVENTETNEKPWDGSDGISLVTQVR